MRASFSRNVIRIIKKIPSGAVATYGQVAAYAGDVRAARQVAWLLHSSSAKENLPWHRVINKRGGISLKPGFGLEEQRRLLRREGITFKKTRTIDLARYQWRPEVG